MILKTILKTLLSIVLVVVALVLFLQSITKIYSFSKSGKPFAGDSIYFPYQGVDWNQPLMKANFHAHTKVDVNGDYTAEQFRAAYDSSAYDIIGIAEHQIINPLGDIPSYEHGWGFNNFHILMLGSTKVDWLDNPLMMMPSHQMQYSIERLRHKTTLLSLNHPERWRHFAWENIAHLRGFDLVEMNPSLDPRPWDLLLSNGYYAPIIASDDSHSITNRLSWFQRCYTMVATEADQLINALQKGKSYGVIVPVEINLKGCHKELPVVKSVDFRNDTLTVRLSELADSIIFIGQNGMTKLIAMDTDSASYHFESKDTYIRAEGHLRGGIIIRLNPLFRGEWSPEGWSSNEAIAPVNYWLTTLNAIAWSLGGVVVLLLLIPLWKKRNKKRRFRR
ncbi:MAG: hypothetical protein RSA50_04310 [Mucinivorans sp.]